MTNEQARLILRRLVAHRNSAQPDQVAMAMKGMTYEERAIALKKKDADHELAKKEVEALSMAIEALEKDN